jgi:hypothetical protein
MRKIPTQTKPEVQVLIHDYHNFVWILLNCARPLEVLHHGILDWGHKKFTFFTKTWKAMKIHRVQKRWELNLLNTKDGCCLHQCCMFI